MARSFSSHPRGVQISNELDEPERIEPAWLALRANGRMEHVLGEAVTRDQKPERCTLNSLADDWIINDESGPRRLVGLNFEPLLTPAEKRFSEVVGVDAMHRWLFRAPGVESDTLIVDPRVADPTPRLPTWVIVTEKGTAGWDSRRLSRRRTTRHEGRWELQTDGWKALDEKDAFLSEVPPATQPTNPPSTQPATHLTSRPATAPALDNPIFTSTDGSRYFNGKTALIVLDKNNAKKSGRCPGLPSVTQIPC